MYTSFKLLSHKNLKGKGEQLLEEHLRGVSNMMVDLAKNRGIVDIEFIEVIEMVGYCHDFSKGSVYFQDYLNGNYNGELKNHGEVSAYLCYYLLPEKWKLYGFIAVKKHHGNIELDTSFFAPSDKENIFKIIESLRINIKELNNIFNVDLESFFRRIEDESLFKAVKVQGRKREQKFEGKSDLEIVEEYIWFQYIWSLLLTADKTQIIRGKLFLSKTNVTEELANEYKNHLREELIKDKKGIENSHLFKVREQVYCEVIESINEIDIENERILSINVPTGTGKTISVYGGALRLKERIKKKKNIDVDIIYCLPFTSVIDQNCEVLKKILKFNNINISSEMLMKYHSLCEIEYCDDESNQYKDFDGKFLMENWQSTFVTTTFIQIFNSIFKGGINSIIHRFHRLAGSIIILDEIQAIDPKYHKIIESVFKVLSEKFNCYIITVTATKPLFLLGRELVKSNQEIFNNMNRIEFHNYMDKKTSLEEFKRIIKNDINNNKEKSFLFIMNTIRSAKEIKEFLGQHQGDRKVYYLSTELLPIHRIEIIDKIKNSKEKTILVSTQLVEAGVDIDYDIVYRDIAPLDSINQSAGRANRNGIGFKGIVNLYRLINEEGKELKGNIYSALLIDITANLFKSRKIIQESEIFNLNNEYFLKVSKTTENLSKEKYDEFINAMRSFNFKTIRENFELIEATDYKTDVIVKYDEEVEKNIKIIREGNSYLEVVNAWRRLNGYKISLSKFMVANKYEEDLGVKFLDKRYYDKNKGFIPNNTDCN